MESAIFSDIEFVGIAADRHVVLDPTRHERRGSCGRSSTISLNSGRSEVGRHAKDLKASALDIREIYAVIPSSPSAFVVDLVPDTRVRLINDGRDTPVEELNLPTTSSWSSNPSVTLPLERYRRESQRHERVAVSVALGRACNLAIADDAPVFWRSLAPSPSTGRRLDLSVGHHENNASHGAIGDASTDQSVADQDEHDAQSLIRTYSLQQWFGSPMEKTQGLAVELQQDPAQPSRPTPPFYRDSTAPGPKATGGEADPISPTQSSISLDLIEHDLPPETKGNKDTDESLQPVTFSRSKDSGTRFNRTFMTSRRVKRKSEEDHPRSRPSRPSPAYLSDQ